MPLIPIGTDVRTHRRPLGNWSLIILNVGIFIFTDWLGGQIGQTFKMVATLDAARPWLYQYLTYQFIHGDLGHLLGNMVFLWVFGDAVCDRMGSLPYVLFYLAGGVFSGMAYAYTADNPIVGASGAIAAVTTAFLVLFPRVQITLLWWFFFVTTFRVPSVLLIIFKMILWDNVIAPSFGSGPLSNVAHSAHIGGYLYGFIISLVFLLVRALPRNQFDLLAVWNRWRRRTAYATQVTFSGPPPARPVAVQEMHSRPIEPLQPTPIERLRSDIIERLSERDYHEALELYQRLIQVDPRQVLPRAQQLEIANYLAQTQRQIDAAHAYEAFLSAYPGTPDTYQVRLLLGLIYNRYLNDPTRAAEHLRSALEGLTVASQRALASDELRLAEVSQSNAGKSE